MSKVLVTDASERASLAVIRSLGRRHINVWAGDSTSFNMGFLSKYCRQSILYPSPELGKTRFVKAMLKLVRVEHFDLLIPITDLAMVPIVEHIEDFERYTRVAAPSYETAMKALDKVKTLRIAKQNDIQFPETVLGEEIDDVAKFSQELRYPVVIKPRMKVTWTGERALILKVSQNNYAYSPHDFRSKWARLISILAKVGLQRDFLVVQKFFQGQGYGVEILMHEGEPTAVFVHKRLREYPITGGASTLRESVRNERLVRLAVRVLRAMEWDGIAMVEFRVNEGADKFGLIEVNGRFWGSLPLAVNAGVDFPYLLYKSMVEKGHFNEPAYRIGVKQRWLAGDFLWLYSSLTNGGGITVSLREFLQSTRVPEDIVALDDLTPACGQLFSIVNLLSEVAAGHRNLIGETIS